MHVRRVHKTVTGQALHYFSRAHSGVPTAPIEGPAAWDGAELASDGSWIETLGAHDIRAMDDALEWSQQIPIARLNRSNFPLQALGDRIDGWRSHIVDGRGFVVLRGLPVDRWNEAQTERLFWGLGLHLGTPGAQNPSGDLLGHVQDLGGDYRAHDVRGYRTSAALSFHCDLADAVGLLCLKKAVRGGRSRIASSVTVFNRLLATHPLLVPRLFRPMDFDTKGEGGVNHFPVAPCRHHEGRLRTFYHSDYFRSAEDYDDVPPLTDDDRVLLDAYDAVASEAALEMDLEVGDVQLLSNHTIVHSRTAFEDAEGRDERRHLLRLWLSFRTPRTFGARASELRSLSALLAALARLRIRKRVGGSSEP